MVGLEYVAQNLSKTSHHNDLFIIERRLRQGKDTTLRLGLYYVLEGVIYQCPDLKSIVESRLMRTAHFAELALQALTEAKAATSDISRPVDNEQMLSSTAYLLDEALQ